MNINYPVLVCAACVNIYWLIVLIKVIVITPKIGKIPNVLPKATWGFISRLLMLPLIMLWLYLPWQSLTIPSPISYLAWLGSGLSVLALGLSCYCWHYMGTAWRIGIDPKEKNALVMTGPFKSIRHPIYTLSMVLMLGSLLTVQTPALFWLCGWHWLLFACEALQEEKYLKKIHGEIYDRYIKDSHRFFP